MAETARQIRDGHGSDLVRRLIARPIHRDRSRQAVAPFEADSDEPVGEGTDGSDASGTFARMQAELAIMKAALTSERDHVDALREHVRRVGDPEALGPEAQATRERWAALVDDLLRARF